MREVPGGWRGRAAVRRCCCALLLASGVAAAPAAVPAAAPLHGQRVLFLNAYDYGRAGVESYTRTYVAAMTAAGLASEDVMVEHLNLNTQGDPAQRGEMRDLLLLRYTHMMGRKADLIIAMQQPALDYLLSDLAPLARGVPVLAINTSGRALPAGSPPAIWQQKANVDFPGTLAQAMSLFPDTKTIFMAVGASEADQALKRSMQQAAQAWQGKVSMEYLDGLTLAQMRETVAHLPADSVLVAGNVNRDVDGAIATP
ncbi:MAG: hypothetical protein RR860_10145, partial [Janthinobacterium sp.]